MPFRRTASSMIRHIYQWLEGDDVEDHLAAIVCNTMFLMQFEVEHPEMDDRYPTQKKISQKALTSAGLDATIKQRVEMVGPSIEEEEADGTR